MKLEIEITEDEIRSAIERKIRVAVADQTSQWNADMYIKERVKEHWKVAADTLIQEELADSKTLRDKITVELERKMRSAITAAMQKQGFK